MIAKEKKQAIIAEYGRSEGDTGCLLYTSICGSSETESSEADQR